MSYFVIRSTAQALPVCFCLYAARPYQKFSLHVNKPSRKQVQQWGEVEKWHSYTASSSERFLFHMALEMCSSDLFEDGQVSALLIEVTRHSVAAISTCHFFSK